MRRSVAVTWPGPSTCWSWWRSRRRTAGISARPPGCLERPRISGKRPSTPAGPARKELEPALVKIETALGKEPFEEALSEGRGLGLEDAVAYARRGRGRRSSTGSGWESLTPSEQRVANLVGRHLSNTEIAALLFVSTTTVKSHLNRGFAKLRLSSRANSLLQCTAVENAKSRSASRPQNAQQADARAHAVWWGARATPNRKGVGS